MCPFCENRSLTRQASGNVEDRQRVAESETLETGVTEEHAQLRENGVILLRMLFVF